MFIHHIVASINHHSLSRSPLCSMGSSSFLQRSSDTITSASFPTGPETLALQPLVKWSYEEQWEQTVTLSKLRKPGSPAAHLCLVEEKNNLSK